MATVPASKPATKTETVSTRQLAGQLADIGVTPQ